MYSLHENRNYRPLICNMFLNNRVKYCGGSKGFDRNQMVYNLCNESHLGEEYFVQM